MRAVRRQGGFTLVEVLVALGIFALVGVVASRMLIDVMATEQHLAERSEQLRTLQRALSLMERDLVQYVPRPVRDAFGDSQPPLQLEAGRELTLTRQGWSNPQQRRRSELVRVRWRLRDGELQRQFWTHLDRVVDAEPTTQTVFRALERFSIDVVDDSGARYSIWPQEPFRDTPSSASAMVAEDSEMAQPRALLVSMHVEPFGHVERYWLLPEAPFALADDGDSEATPGADGAAEEEGDRTQEQLDD